MEGKENMAKRELTGQCKYHPARSRGHFRRNRNRRVRGWIFWICLVALIGVLAYAFWRVRHVRPQELEIREVGRPSAAAPQDHPVPSWGGKMEGMKRDL